MKTGCASLRVSVVALFVIAAGIVSYARASEPPAGLGKRDGPAEALSQRDGGQGAAQEAQAEGKADAGAGKEGKKRSLLPLVPYYDNGFFLETADEQFRLNITGVLQADARFYTGATKGPDSLDTYSPNSFDIRRARFDFRGWHYKSNVFRLQLEMADTPYLRNAYWIFQKWPEVRLQLGQFKIPAGGADFLAEEAQANFIEYSADTPISPHFDRGIMLWGTPWDGALQYAVGAFTGTGPDIDVPTGDVDKSKDLAGRLMLVPFKHSDIEFLKGLHVAGGYQYGMESIRTAKGETSNRTEGYESQWFNWRQKNVTLDHRARWGAECHYLVGPFTASYEYNRIEWHGIRAFDAKEGTLLFEKPDTYFVDVHQVWLSYFITGEQKTMQDVFFAWRQPKPKRNFSLRDHTWGAWEILVRAALRNGSGALFDKATPVLDGSKRGHSITGGINWIANPKVRVMFNVVYLKNDDGAYNGIISQKPNALGGNDTRYLDHELDFLLRCVLTI